MKLKHQIFLLLLLVTTKIVAQDKKEQIAFDFFMEKVFKERYSNYHKVWFNKKSTGTLSAEGPFFKCFNESDFKDSYRNLKKVDTTFVDIFTNDKSIKFLTRYKNKALSIKVNNSITIGDFSFVYIQVYLKNHFVDHFLFRIKEDTVDDYCLEPEII